MGFWTRRDPGIPPKARILLVKTHAIGDLLLTTPAIRDIRRAYPDAHITLLVGSWSAPVIRENPHIDAFMEVDDRIFLDRQWLGLAGLWFKLLRKRFDAAFIFHPLALVHLFVLLTGIPRRYGLTTDKGSPYLTAGFPINANGVYFGEDYQKVAAAAGVETGPSRLEAHAAPVDAAEVERLLALDGIGSDAEILLVAPGGGRNSKDDVEAKRWPRENFEAVLRELQTRYPSLKMIVCGSAGDRQETDFLAERVPRVVDWTAKITLTQLVALAGRSRAILSNDSAILHIGAAQGVPVVTAFGPTSRDRFLPEGARQYALQSTVPCSPCYIGGHFPGCTIGHQCMREITPAQILERLEAALVPG